MKFLMKFLLIFFILILTTSATCYASDWESIKGAADKFIEKGGSGANIGDVNQLVSGLANILTTVGVVVVLAGLLIIGIKYMTASPEEAAKLKTKLVGLVVSGVVVIGAYGIWRLAFNIFSEMAK